MNQSIMLLGVKITNCTSAEVIQYCEESIVSKKIKTYFTPNVDFLVKAQKDEQFKAVLNSSDVNFPDGKPLIWASKYFNTPIKEKVSGSSIFFRLCKLSVLKRYRIFLLGAAPGVASLAKYNLEKHYPGILISGVYSPSLNFENNQTEIDQILTMLKESHSDILVVGMGAPKQENFITKYKDVYQIPVSLGLGGTIDFAAGIQRMPPEWIKRSGLGWLFRLALNPRKFWKRYILEDLIFFKYIYQQKRGRQF